MATYTTTNAPLPWMEPYLQDYMSRAQDVANMPYEQSPQTYTDPNSMLQTGWQAAYNRALGGSPEMAAARSALTQTIQGGFAGRGASGNPFAGQMNPYLDAQNPYSAQMNPFAGQGNAYAGVQNAAAGVSNAAADASNPYAQQMNQFAGVGNSAANAANPFAGQINPYAGVQNLNAGVANPFAAMNNPYLSQAISDAQGDLVRSYNLTQKPAWDQAMQRSGSFGNTGVMEMQQNASNDLQKNLARIGTDMRMNAYNQAAGLNEAQAGRLFNAGESLAGRLYGAGQQQAQNLYGSGESLAGRQFQAGSQLQQNLFGAGQQQAQNMYNAGESLAGRQFNAGESQAGRLYGAGQQQAQNLYNAGQTLQGNLFNAGQQQAQNLYNSGQAQMQNRFGAGQQYAQNLFNAGQDLASRQDAINAQERGFQQSAIGMAPTFANQDYTDINALLSAGNQRQLFNQGLNDQNYKWWQEAQNFPRQQLAAYGQALGVGGGGTSTQTAPDPSTASQLLGGGLTGAAIYKMLFGG